MQLKTHMKIDQALSGEVVALAKGYAKVRLKTSKMMVADEVGLIHGGFCFSAADFAAMAAVNDPYVVLAKSESKFLAPVRVGEEVIFKARVIENDGRKQRVEVIGMVAEKAVYKGLLTTVILEKHILT